MYSYHNSTLNQSISISGTLIDLRSDTVTLPSEDMLKAAYRSPLGDDVYSEDFTVLELQSFAAEMFHKDSALFFPSGTQSNLAAILSHCNRGEEALVGREYHSFSHEAHGASVLGSVALSPIDTNYNDELTVESLKNEIKPDDSHYPITKLVCLENTVSGKVQDQHKIDEVCRLAHKSGLKIHLDGARIFHAHVHSGLSLESLTSNIDSVSVCLSKGLGSPVGSLLLGNKELIEKAKRIRKLLGGGMRQVGIIAGCGLYALQNNIERLSDDHSNAKRLADGLSTIEQLEVTYKDTQTNMVFIEFSEDIEGDLSRHLFENKVNTTFTSGKSRLVCHMGISTENIDHIIKCFVEFFCH